MHRPTWTGTNYRFTFLPRYEINWRGVKYKYANDVLASEPKFVKNSNPAKGLREFIVWMKDLQLFDIHIFTCHQIQWLNLFTKNNVQVPACVVPVKNSGSSKNSKPLRNSIRRNISSSWHVEKKWNLENTASLFTFVVYIIGISRWYSIEAHTQICCAAFAAPHSSLPKKRRRHPSAARRL